MESDERDEAAVGEDIVPQTLSDGYSERDLEATFWEQRYIEKGGSGGMDGAVEYYREYFEKTEKEDFLKVPTADLDYFSSEILCESRLTHMLADAVVFFKLHNTWEIYICPKPECHCWFAEGNSLIMHLTREHNCNVWPLPQHDLTEEQWCSEVLHSMVWKPIDVDSTLNMLAATCQDFTSADGRSGGADIDSLVWPLSEDVQRSKLLVELRKRFMILLAREEQASFSLISNGCLRALVAVASEHIRRQLDPGNSIPLPFRALLDSSLFPFRFMDHKSLSYFVQLVSEMCELVIQAAEPQTGELDESRDGDFNWDRSDLDVISDPIADGTVGYYFVLDAAKIKLRCGGEGGVASWLLKAPGLPLIKEVPTRASEILQLAQSKVAALKECLATAYMRSVDQSVEFPSCFKLWSMGHWQRDMTYMFRLDTAHPDLALNSEVNHMPSTSTEHNKRQRIAYSSEAMQYHLELIKLTCELQCLGPQVCRLCAIDLRVYILPLLRSFLRMKLYVYMNMGLGPVAGEVGKENADSDHMMEKSPQENPGRHICSEVKGQSVAKEGSDVTTSRLGFCKKDGESLFIPLELRSSCNNNSSSSKRSEESFRHEFISSNTDGSNSKTGIPEFDPLVIDGGEPPVASNVNLALSRNKSSIVRAVSESEAKPEANLESDVGSQSQAEPGYEVQPESQDKLVSESLQEFIDDVVAFEFFSDSETDAEEESEGEPLQMNHPILSQVDLFIGESKVRDIKGMGLFVCVKVTDVMKHCLETSCMPGAHSIWVWKTNKTWKYWHCFGCGRKFTDKESHMVHMECAHHLGLSYGENWSMPPRVWQGQEAEQDVERRDETLGNSIHSLDDSITADCTFRFFIVDAVNSYEVPFCSEVPKEIGLGETKPFDNIVLGLQNQLSCLRLLCDAKHKLLHHSEIDELDAKMVQNFDQIEKLKQDLSNICVRDYRNEILHSVRSFMHDKISMNGELTLWASERLEGLLGSVTCSYLPDSIKLELESPGKMLIYIKEDAVSGFGFGFGFAYIGMSWKFSGEFSLLGTKKNISGSFQLAGFSDIGSVNRGYLSESKVGLYGCKLTSAMKWLKQYIDRDMTDTVWEKLLEFQTEFKRKIKVGGK